MIFGENVRVDNTSDFCISTYKWAQIVLTHRFKTGKEGQTLSIFDGRYGIQN